MESPPPCDPEAGKRTTQEIDRVGSTNVPPLQLVWLDQCRLHAVEGVEMGSVASPLCGPTPSSSAQPTSFSSSSKREKSRSFETCCSCSENANFHTLEGECQCRKELVGEFHEQMLAMRSSFKSHLSDLFSEWERAMEAQRQRHKEEIAAARNVERRLRTAVEVACRQRQADMAMQLLFSAFCLWRDSCLSSSSSCQSGRRRPQLSAISVCVALEHEEAEIYWSDVEDLREAKKSAMQENNGSYFWQKRDAAQWEHSRNNYQQDNGEKELELILLSHAVRNDSGHARWDFPSHVRYIHCEF